jgi:hypothetical protein
MRARYGYAGRVAQAGRSAGGGGAARELVTLPQAAAARGLRVRTLQAAAASGQLRARRFGGKVWATTLLDVDAWLRNAQHRPGPRPRRG